MPLFRRKDADLARGLGPARRLMPILMRGRNEANVLLEQRIDAGPALELIRDYNATHEGKITIFHLVLHALVETLAERPRLNRFVSGGRIYQRRGIWISYSAKKSFDDDGPVFVVKKQLAPGRSLEALVADVQGGLREGRGGRSAGDRETALAAALPVVLARLLVWALRTLDRWNLLPASYVAHDPLFASVFVANLGSLKMDSVFHHNFEYGNVPIFCCIGRVHDAVVARPDGTVGTRKEVVLRWTFDERIEDGFYCAKALERLQQRLEQPADAAAYRPVQATGVTGS